MKPVFIFCTPRSGSTLLQRLLVSHPQIASASEPWILLPFINATKPENILASYSHQTSVKATNKFINKMPKGVYQAKLREFVLGLYEAAATGNETYFLDKTPRYYYIIDEIAALFPEAKFIFLNRDPRDTLASVIDTWCNGGFLRLYKHHDDLYLAPKLLSQAYEKYIERSLAVNYEDLVSDHQSVCQRIFEHLELDSFEVALEQTNIGNAEHEMGDSTGQRKYSLPSKNSIGNWQKTFNNPVRRWYLQRSLNSIAKGVSSDVYSSAADARLSESANTHWNIGALRDLVEILCLQILTNLKLHLFFRIHNGSIRRSFYE